MLRAPGALASFCTLYKALSKGVSDDMWKLKPKTHMVQVMCEVQSELDSLREFWTCRDESFMGVVSSMAHSRGGSATASTIILAVCWRHIARSL